MIQNPAPIEMYRLTPEVHIQRIALGLPTTCHECKLDFDVFSPTCSRHGQLSGTWTTCQDCGRLLTKAKDGQPPANGREVWFHVVATGYGYNSLIRECARAESGVPLTKDQEEWLAAMSSELPQESKDRLRAMYLALPPKKRDGIWARAKMLTAFIFSETK